MPVFHSSGALGLVPQSKFAETVSHPEYEPAVMMTAPDGTKGYVPKSKVRDTMGQGYIVGQMLKSDKTVTDAFGHKHILQDANAPQFGAAKNFALNAAQTVWPSDRGLVEQAKWEADQLIHHPIDMLSESFKAANPIRMITNSAGAEGQAAHDAFKKHDYEGAIAHAGYSVIPGIGHTLGDAGEQIRNHDFSGGLGKTAGVAAQLALSSPEAVDALAHPAKTLTKTIPEVAGRATGKVFAPLAATRQFRLLVTRSIQSAVRVSAQSTRFSADN